MRIRSLLLGQRPSVPAWAVLYFQLGLLAIGGYVASVGPHVLPGTSLGLLSVAGELVCRALLVGELTRLLVHIARDGDISHLTKLCLLGSLLAVVAMAATFELRPGPYNLVASGVGVAGWVLVHRVVSAQLYLFQDLDAWRRKLPAPGEQRRPEWLSQLATELESDPNYRDLH